MTDYSNWYENYKNEELELNKKIALIDAIMLESQELLNHGLYDDAFRKLCETENVICNLNFYLYVYHSSKISDLFSKICINENPKKYGPFLVNLFLAFIFKQTWNFLLLNYDQVKKNRDRSFTSNWPFKSNSNFKNSLKYFEIYESSHLILTELFKFTYDKIPDLLRVEELEKLMQRDAELRLTKETKSEIDELVFKINNFYSEPNWDVLDEIYIFPETLLKQYIEK